MFASAYNPYDRQMELEQLFDKHQLMPRVRAEFEHCKEFNFIAYCEEQGIPAKFGIDLLAQMAIRKRADLVTLVGLLRYHFDDGQATASMLEKAAIADLVDWSPSDRMFIVKFPITDDVQQELDKYQYPLPMVVPPLALQSNLDTGYLTQKGSVILKNNHHDHDVVLEHLDRLNNVKFSVNLDTARRIQNKWTGVDRQKEGESWADFQKRRKAFRKYCSVADEVLGLLISEGNELYLTHRYDKRGRTYCMGFHVTYQGTDWNKAILEFADKELLED